MFDKNEQILIVCGILALVLFFIWRRRQKSDRFNQPLFFYVRIAVILVAIAVLSIETFKEWNVVKVFALAAAVLVTLYIYRQFYKNQDEDKGSDHQ